MKYRPGVTYFRVRCVTNLVCLSVMLGIQISSSSSQTLVRDDVVKGVWSDACPCHIPCPCWKHESSNVKECLNIQVFHVVSGSFKGSNLANATFVLLGIPTSEFGAPVPSTVFYDRSRSRISGSRVNELFHEVFKLDLTDGVRRVSVDAKIETDRQAVSIPHVLNYQVGLKHKEPEDVLSPEVESFLYPWLINRKQWRTELVRYQTSQNAMEYTDTNSLTGEFEIPVFKTVSYLPKGLGPAMCSHRFDVQNPQLPSKAP